MSCNILVISFTIILAGGCFAAPPVPHFIRPRPRNNLESYTIEGIVGAKHPTSLHKNNQNISKGVVIPENSISTEISEITSESQSNVPAAIVVNDTPPAGKFSHRNKLETVETTTEFDVQRHQAESAHYSFDSSVTDNINDHSITRNEARDGLKVTGMYSYSDGYFYRTVHYVADENGYRVIKQDSKRIGDGPQFNPDGRADVQGSLIGGYSIKLGEDEPHAHYKEINRTKPSSR